MVKTTIQLSEELWKKFSIKVIQEYGGRKKTDIFAALAEGFVSTPSKTVEDAVNSWIESETKKRPKKHA